MGRQGGRLVLACDASKWKNSWQATLLAASTLTSCFLMSQAQSWNYPLPIMVEPPNPSDGGSVTLTPRQSLQNFILCSWYRGLKTSTEENLIATYGLSPYYTSEWGEAYTGQESVNSDCSLTIWNLTPEDSGTYTLSMRGLGQISATQYVQLEVSEMLPRPFLWPVESTVAEHAQVTLNCTTSSSSKVLISWYKDGKRLQTQPGSYVGLDGILSLHDVTKSKAGIYTCEVTNSASTVTSNPSTIRMAYSSSLGPGGIAGIVIGSLALVALTGSLVGLFLYVCRQREKTPAETATVPSAPPAYENFPLPAQAHSVSPPYVENIYKSI